MPRSAMSWRPTSSLSTTRVYGRGPESAHRPSRLSSSSRFPRTAGAPHPSNSPPFNRIDKGACFGESGMEQNSDTRARRQHSTVPVDKGALRAQAKLRAHGQHSATEVNRNTLQNEPHHLGADLSATGHQNANAPPDFPSPRWRAKHAGEAKLAQLG